MSERAALSYMRRMRERNKVFVSMLGMGYHGTITPAIRYTRKGVTGVVSGCPLSR